MKVSPPNYDPLRSAVERGGELLRVLSGVALVVGLIGCRDAPGSLQPQAVPDRAIVASVGTLEGNGPELLSNPRSGGLSPSGRYIVVVDRDAPHLRILDRDSGRLVSAGSEGGGPGELRNPVKAVFEDDTTVVVLSSSRLDWFGVDGSWAGGVNLDPLGILAMSVTVGCDEELLLYGPRHGTDANPAWLHAVKQGKITRSFGELPGPGRVAYGRLEGVDGGAQRIFVWHQQGDAEAGFWVECEYGATSFLPSRVSEGGGPEAAFVEDASRTMSLTLPDTLFRGAVQLSSAEVLQAESWKDEGRPVTEFTRHGTDECSRFRLTEAWKLFDLGPQGVLVARREPFPKVILLDRGWVEARLGNHECTS